MKICELEKKLTARLEEIAPVVILASGGADSTLLANFAAKVLNADQYTVTHLKMPFSPENETESIIRWAKEKNIPFRLLELDILRNSRVAENGPERCYFCKKMIIEYVKSEFPGFDGAFADGTVLDDYGDYRPGLKATEETGVVHPLADCGFSKKEVRLLARFYRLPNWNLPASACYASRIPCGEPLTPKKIEMISAAEKFLADSGFRGCRVRCIDGNRARVEVRKIHQNRLTRLWNEIMPEILAAGFADAEIAPEGYVRGAMNRKEG
jgi:uncharacterized protein